MKRVVITGPTGTIGIALINLLIKEGIEVTAVCRKGSVRKKNIPEDAKVKCIELDLDSLKSLPQILGESYDVFYHFGWDGTFGNSRNNMKGQLDNISYTLDAVEAASQIGCKKFIGAGSQAEYGRVEGLLTPDTPVFPENGYGIAKLCAGQMSRILCEQKKIEHVWTRILSVYGPHDGENTMIMSTIRKLLNGEVPNLTKGEQQWDYLYSKDAAKAMYLMGLYGKHGKTYCIGSGGTRQLLEYVKIMRNEINESAELGIGAIPYAEKQVMHLCADIQSLTEDTGFIPEYSFEQGILETINWYKGRE
ncbi:MAG: NAD(P)-dependent oxidoreductase [Tyzzerella sp.]|nr:NAD(P)-dependent oxidoreductase [Tyzzerella sp.]